MLKDISYVFEDLRVSATRAGYCMNVNMNSNPDYPVLSMKLRNPLEASIMPEIDITTIPDVSNKCVYFKPTVRFPALTTNDGDYSDNIAHVISNKWAEVGKFITDLNNFEYYTEE